VTALTSVVIPVRNGGPRFARLLDALACQELDGQLELIVADSASHDGSSAAARRHGAQVIEVEPGSFGHGRTRNRLLERASGDHVALLTQDAVPAHSRWLAELVGGFELADDVGLAFGPYLPMPEASPMTARELDAWFGSLEAPGGGPSLVRLSAGERDVPAPDLFGARGYFTDANGCVLRAAWEEVRFRDVAYAEDHLLAHDMLRAGYAKVYVPSAPVIHSHDYSSWQWLQRGFDEARAMREVYGAIPVGEPRTALRNLRGNVGADWRLADRAPRMLLASTSHHLARTIGTLLGAHAGRVPAGVRARLSLEGRR
jgi:glycosyltransferase involved in cell wall biosynthesis